MQPGRSAGCRHDLLSALSPCRAVLCCAGGLGDVMQALPKALAARGHRVMVIAPRYKQYDDAWETGVRHRLRVYDAEQEVRVGRVARPG